jgi:ankyrin repeat protein
MYSSSEIVQIFIDAGADVNFSEKDNKHKTPLWYAKKLNKPKVINLLKKAGAVK